MTRVLWLQLVRDASERNEFLNRSPLFNLVRSEVAIGLSLLQVARTLIELNKLRAQDALSKAERAYAKAQTYIERLPENERVSAKFALAGLRSAIDLFLSS
jgi:hypothetical protein